MKLVSYYQLVDMDVFSEYPMSDDYMLTGLYLDAVEQEKVVLSLETSHSRQSFMWRVGHTCEFLSVLIY